MDRYTETIKLITEAFKLLTAVILWFTNQKKK